MARQRSARAAPLPVTDLTQSRLTGLSGKPVIEIAQATLEAGRSMVETWRALEPVVQSLTAKAKLAAEAEMEGPDAMRLLSIAAGVVQKVGAAAQGILRTSDGLSRLALLLEGGVQRSTPQQMSEKQLARVLFEVGKQFATNGNCPYCTTPAVEVAPA